jgi:hypothetical protein
MSAPNGTKRILFRGDDAGGCRSATEAIVEACAAGVLRNVSVMACGPAFEEAVPLLKQLDGACLGLHLVLNAEWAGPKWGPVLPASEVPSLLDGDTGYFTPAPQDLKERGFSVKEAAAEAAAQLAHARAAGLPIVYLDEHMGVGWLPGLRDALSDLCRREGLIEAGAIAFGTLPKSDDTNLVDRWLRSLDAADSGIYRTVTHPGKDAPDMQAYYLAGGEPGVVARERDAERRALCDPRLREGLAAHGIVSVRYDEV